MKTIRKVQEKTDKIKEINALEIAFTLGYVIVIPLVGGVFLGNWLDKKLNTAPIALLFLALVAIALSCFLLVGKFKRYFE